MEVIMVWSDGKFSFHIARFVLNGAVLGAVMFFVTACAVVAPVPPPGAMYAPQPYYYSYYDYPPYYYGYGPSTSITIGGFGHGYRGGGYYSHGGRGR